MKGKGGEEKFRAFPQFQICHYMYTTACSSFSTPVCPLLYLWGCL